MKIKYLGLAALFTCAIFAACSDDEDQETEPGNQETPGQENPETATAYVIAGTVSGNGGQSAYLLKSGSLMEGTVTSKGDGLETDYTRAATWLFFGNKYLYRLAYNMGQAGTTASFYLDANGNIQKRPGEYNILNFTAYGTYQNKIITTATGETNQKDEKGNTAYGINFSILDVENETAETKTISAENFLGNKEYVMMAGLLEANGKIYAGVVPLGCSPYGVAAGGVKEGNEDLVQQNSGGTGGGMYTAGTLTGTQYPDECYVAIFNDDTFTNPTIVKTDKMSWAAGRMRSAYYQTVWAADNGDIYVFSPSYAKLESDPRQQTKHPSSVMRIKANATEFDSTYEPFNIEAASGGKEVYRCWHITEDYFLLQMYSQGINAKGTGTTRMAIYKGEDRAFKYVSGLPDENLISSFPVKNPYCENGSCYISVVTTEEGSQPCIYRIDPQTAQATQGLAVVVDEPGAIGKLIAQ